MFRKTAFALVFALTAAYGGLVGSASAQDWQYYGNATAGAPDFARRDVYGANRKAEKMQQTTARALGYSSHKPVERRIKRLAKEF
jgi:hypothetical protein